MASTQMQMQPASDRDRVKVSDGYQTAKFRAMASTQMQLETDRDHIKVNDGYQTTKYRALGTRGGI